MRLGADGFWEMVQKNRSHPPANHLRATNEPTSEPSGEPTNSAPIADAGVDQVTKQARSHLMQVALPIPMEIHYRLYGHSTAPARKSNRLRSANTVFITRRHLSILASCLGRYTRCTDAVTIIYDTNTKTGCATKAKHHGSPCSPFFCSERRKNISFLEWPRKNPYHAF